MVSTATSNRTAAVRSSCSLGLFFLVYVLVYAGALVAEALSVDADINTLLQLAWIDLP